MKSTAIAAIAASLFALPAVAGQFQGGTSAAEFAAKHFAQDHETGDGARFVPSTSSGNPVVSTSNSDLAAFAKERLANGPEDRR